MTADEKNWIDEASIEALLAKWRFAPIGDPYFQETERAEYFQNVMFAKRSENPGAWVAASKSLGW